MIKITRQTEGIRLSEKDNDIFIHDEDISELYVELYKVLPPGCLMRPSHGVECMDTISSLSKAKHGEYGKKLAAFLQGLKSLASCRIGA